MFSAVSVCLSVCQHDKLQTIKRSMMKLGGYMHCTKISPNSNVKVKGQGHRGQKTKKCCIIFGSHPLGHGPHVACFLGAVLGGASTPVGKSARAV